MRERRAVLQQSRKSKSSGQRNDATHAGPSNDKNLPEFRRLLLLMSDPCAQEVGKACTRKNPRQPKQDEENAENRAVGQDGGELIAANRCANGRKLKSDENEDQPVQDKGQGLPHRPHTDTNRRR